MSEEEKQLNLKQNLDAIVETLEEERKTQISRGKALLDVAQICLRKCEEEKLELKKTADADQQLRIGSTRKRSSSEMDGGDELAVARSTREKTVAAMPNKNVDRPKISGLTDPGNHELDSSESPGDQ